MKTGALLSIILPFTLCAQWSKNTTPAYPELIAHYQKLDREHKEIECYAMGTSDMDIPIYLCIINGAQDSLKTFEKARNGTTLLINNAIHPGEPDGVNACLIWLDEWIRKGKPMQDLPVIAIIPAYNVGGMFNRSATSRANQEGPEIYGFRANSQNLDLNRDCIKMDSPNMFTFARIFHALDPDVFVDTHVSNGADYQYTLTYIASLKERMAPSIRELTYNNCIPSVKQALSKKGTDLFPYIELKEDVPDKGIVAFNDLPRYAMGYASLFHSVSFTLETHMLKPFPQRVEATLQFIEELLPWMRKNAKEIEHARKTAIEWSYRQHFFRFNYKMTEKADTLIFKGFTSGYKTSEVSGLPRLYYDRSRPFEKKVPYYGQYIAEDSVEVPEYYFVSVADKRVIERLSANGIRYWPLRSDSSVLVEQLFVVSFATGENPYEGHYLHGEVLIESRKDTVLLSKGTLCIPTVQPGRQWLVSVMEPATEDSFFAWNFFDSHLQRKEHFSPYVFEDKAAELLRTDPRLRSELEAKKRENKAFAENGYAQLEFIYSNSPYFEKTTLNRLPVFRSVEK